MTPDQAGAASRKAVARLGTAYLECPRTLRRARELGLTGWAAYVAGRGGALGDVRSDTVAAALGLIEPEAVRSGWSAARAVMPPGEVAAQMLAECCRWGAEHLEDTPHAARLVTLLETVAVAADGSALPLFAAWRAMPLPGGRVSFVSEPDVHEAPSHVDTFADDIASLVGPPLPWAAAAPFSATTGYWSPRPVTQPSRGPAAATSGHLDGPGARAAVALHLLAEHRAGAMLVSIRAAGLTPVQALIAGPEGEAAAEAFGWRRPYPHPRPLLRRRVWADTITDRLCGQVFEALSEVERAELVSLLDQALAHTERA